MALNILIPSLFWGEKGDKGDPGDPGGPTGPQGDPGDPGADGTDGATWLTGSGVPSNGDGVDNDLYLNTANGDIYKKVSGAWGSPIGNIKGATGSTGATGATGDTGDTGDTGAAGADGADGATWRTGTGVPSNSLGVNGDLYLDEANGNVYKKAAGAYSNIANITGPTGATGADGPPGSDGTDGLSFTWLGAWDSGTLYEERNVVEYNGSSYIAIASNSNDAPPSANWELLAEKGDDGATGSTGSNGADGADGGFKFFFNTGTSGDPGSGKFLFNNATFSSATQLNISETDGNSLGLATLLTKVDDATSANKALVTAIKQGGGAFFSFYITAALTDQGSYDTYPITPITSGGSISNNDVFHLSFHLMGASDLVVGPGSATDNAIVRFDATTGKLVQNSGVTVNDSNLIECSAINALGGAAQFGIEDRTTAGKYILIYRDLNIGYIRLYNELGTGISFDASGNLRTEKSGDGQWKLAGTCVSTGTVATGKWDYTSNVANVDFKDLGDYSEIWVIIRNITMSAGAFRTLQVSTDNGATFLSASGDYVSVSNTGAESNQTGVSFQNESTTAARSGSGVIRGFNVTTQKWWHNDNRDTSASYLIPSTSALSAIRILGAANITGGLIRVYGR